MKITIPLTVFVAYLAKVERETHWPYLEAIDWLLSNFKFSDTEATYTLSAS